MHAIRWIVATVLFCTLSFAGSKDINIEGLDPTPLFPRPLAGGPLKQRVLLRLNNAGAAIQASVVVRVGPGGAHTDNLGVLPSGNSVQPISIPDLAAPSRVSVLVRETQSGRILASRQFPWQPQKKWKIFAVSYSHHDLGYGNYPHRIRTEIRHTNLERALEFCRATDHWDKDSQYRFVLETAEPLTSFLSSHSEADADELAQRVREGRIQIGGLHSTVLTEEMSDELLARLVYLAGRHQRDLFDTPAIRTALDDDVPGLTWPLATVLKEADIKYLFHGHNLCCNSMEPAQSEPVFYWPSPDGDSRNAVLVRSITYGGYTGDSVGAADEARIEEAIQKFGRKMPGNSLLLQHGDDFTMVTMDQANRIHAWNQKYAYPHLICSTLDMFFDDLASQLKPGGVKSFAKNGNDEWADEDASDAWLLGLARTVGERIPTAEKFATIAGTLAGGSYPWVDLYQAYHRMLTYHEHSDGMSNPPIDQEGHQRYETEQVEDREMVTEARDFAQRSLEPSLGKLEGLISTDADASIIVFNPLAWARTDVVRVRTPRPDPDFRLVDAASGKETAWQALGNGEIAFVADEVPATGYRSYSIVPAAPTQAGAADSAAANTLENRFYKVIFDPETGAITSLRDKDLDVELVDTAAPQRFNEYLYERYEGESIKEPPRWYRVRSAVLKATPGPLVSQMTVTGAPIGTESMQQTVMLYKDLKRIDFALDMVKAPLGYQLALQGPGSAYDKLPFCQPCLPVRMPKEAAYVALPFAIPDFQIRYDLPGMVTEPIRQQFAGSVTAFYATRHFSDISNQQYGVTVSSPEIALMEYGWPRSCPMTTVLWGVSGREGEYESVLEYPKNSRVYLYLLDNMFDTNIRLDQRGPLRFTWSIRSHAGNWQTGHADRFGWEVLNPLVPRITTGRNSGPLPPASSFLSVDQPNVACLALKPAEANGSGFIVRLHETQGKAVTVKVSLPFAAPLTSANETSLVEDDRPVSLSIENENSFHLDLPAFGIKTVRVLRRPPSALQAVAGASAEAVSDKEIRLSWDGATLASDRLGYFNVYRGTRPDFAPSLLHLVARVSGTTYLDRPQLNYGGWINQRLAPDTPYYYRVAAVDRWNNQGPLSHCVQTKTKNTAEAHALPLRVEALHAVLVSPLGPYNYVNLLFRTNPEPDVHRYEIHRSELSEFEAAPSTKIGVADGSAVVKGSSDYGHVPVDFHMRDYDHMMYQDYDVHPLTTYYYRVCAIDDAGQRGPCSEDAAVQTKDYPPPTATARAQSVSTSFEARFAISGVGPFVWVSAPFGGGIREHPLDTWLEVQLPRTATLLGVKLLMERDPAAKGHRHVRVEYLNESTWTVLGEVAEAPPQEVRIALTKPIETDALRFYFPSQGNGSADGTARIAQVLLILPDGTETTVKDFDNRPLSGN